MWKVQLFKLNYDERESNAVSAILDGDRTWLTMGEKTQEFEQKFEIFLGHGIKATSVSNGTAALHMALLALGIGPGDEVIVPALTFVADVNVVKLVGADPVIADCVSYDVWNIDPKDMERKITPHTKAVIVVDYAGYPCKMDELSALCRKKGIYLIDDAAHSVGAFYKGQPSGTFGDISCFSFFTNKNLSVGEGGMFVTKDELLHQKGRYLRSHGMTTLTLDRHQGRAVTYDVVQPGLNYRIDEIRAALGIVQLEKLPEANEMRRKLCEIYQALLSNVRGVSVPFLNYPNCVPSYHIFPVILDSHIDRLKIIEELKQAGIQSSIHYPSFKEFSAFQELKRYETPIADYISRQELTLPLYPTLQSAEVELVCSALKSALARLNNS